MKYFVTLTTKAEKPPTEEYACKTKGYTGVLDLPSERTIAGEKRLTGLVLAQLTSADYQPVLTGFSASVESGTKDGKSIWTKVY